MYDFFKLGCCVWDKRMNFIFYPSYLAACDPLILFLSESNGVLGLDRANRLDSLDLFN